ncbi:hypothetical protein GCM10020331_018120 [Ectobacillus funiculus]
MDDDFNTANAVTELYNLANYANQYLLEQHTSKAVIETFFLTEYKELFEVLGLSLNQQQELLDEEIETLIEQRNNARKRA